MIILLQNIWFLKEFLACNDCFGLLSKIKKGSGASIWWTFSARFFHKNVPYLILYQWTKFQCYILFLSQDTNKMLLSSYLENDDIMNFKIFLGSISKAMADMEKKNRGKYENWDISRMKRAFRWNKKTFFRVFEGLSFGEK